MNQDLTRCDQLASQKLSLLHPLARTRPRNGHLKTNRTDLVYFCSPCMSSPRLSRTVRYRMQVGNQTHFFEVGEINLSTNDHKRIQTLHTKHTCVFKPVLHMLLGVSTVSRHWSHWQHGYSLAHSFSAVISTEWHMKFLRPDCGSSTCSRLLDELCLSDFTQPFVELSRPRFFLKA